MNQSEVESLPPPEWLLKLEERREKKLKSKLGHESGFGAPCTECDKCPGLDLHFWRKVCRNCKCRKDQHTCQDDDLTGWAQFEILGQIRSKPAYIKIKAFADQPIKLDWVPPNSEPDIVSDYMNKLGSNHIPVAGSDAAAKRKQQLQFQVPAHDLDATLCDNLTEKETAQLEQYVKKIRENCVGQGNVVRIGEVKRGVLNQVNSKEHMNEDFAHKLNVVTKLSDHPVDLVKDKIIMNLLSSKQLVNAALLTKPLPIRTHLIVHSDVMQPSAFPAFIEAKMLSSTKEKLKRIPINIATAESIITNGPFYDKLLSTFDKNNLDVCKDPVLKAIVDFLHECKNPIFKNDIDYAIHEKDYSTPNKNGKTNVDTFNSPVPLRYPAQSKIGSLIKQDTPMRKVKFGAVNVVYDLGFPADIKIEKDKVLYDIVNSDKISNILQSSKEQNHPRHECKSLILANGPLITDFSTSDFQHFSPAGQQKICEIALNKDYLLSGFINGPCYDRILNQLENKGINITNCPILYPMKLYRKEILKNPEFNDEIMKYTQSIPNIDSIAVSNFLPSEYYVENNLLEKGVMSGSGSTDSGFESKPSTPSHSYFPCLSGNEYDNYKTESNRFAEAALGKFSSIPAIQDLNMYPTVQPATEKLENKFSQIGLNSDQNLHENQLDSEPVLIMKCQHCKNFILSGEVAVKAERAGKDIAWHPECFKCHKCKELLADLVYFFHSGNVYCGRDLAIILKIPRCNACDELIFTKEYTAAENSTFHIKHFCCYQCDIPLAGKQYIPDEKTNMPLCLNCYDEYYAEKCKRCQTQIGPTEQGVRWGDIHWHGTCFVCAGFDCGKSLIGGRFCVKQNMPFCSPACVRSVIH